jgi:ADP-ribose pyrophosphatase YjhB (NUDIX family)
MLGIPGGHLEEGESARQAAVREIEEELGLHIAQDRLVAYSTVFMRTNYEYVIQEFYVELFEIENPVNKETDKCSELVWCAPDNLPADVQDIFEVIIQQGFISGERYLEIGY